MLCLYVIHSRRPMLRFPPQTCEKTQLYLWHLPSSPLALPRPQRAVSWVSHAIFPLSLSRQQLAARKSPSTAQHAAPNTQLVHLSTCCTFALSSVDRPRLPSHRRPRREACRGAYQSARAPLERVASCSWAFAIHVAPLLHSLLLPWAVLLCARLSSRLLQP